MDFRNINLKTKLLAAFLSLAALTAVTGLTGIFFTWSVGNEGTQVGERHAPRAVAATDVKLATTQAHLLFEEIVTSVKKVADFVSEIAAASQEQSAGIDQVSNAITNMDEVTQQNASLVEETTAALNSAQTQLEDLRQAVGFFKTRQAPQAPRAVDEDFQPRMQTANPVAKQQQTLARRVSGGGAAAALAADEDWQEF